MPRIPRPLNPPANASSTLQLHSPIIYRTLLSFPSPLNSPANASSTLQLHSPIVCRTLLSCPRPLNSPAIAVSREASARLAPQPPATARPTTPTFAPARSRFHCKTQRLRAILLFPSFSPHLCCLHQTTDFTSLCFHLLLDMTSHSHHLCFLPPSNRTSSQLFVTRKYLPNFLWIM